MPLYDYRCQECEHEFELQRPMDRRDEADCPKCGSRRVKRLLRAFATLGHSGGGSCSSGGSGGG